GGPDRPPRPSARVARGGREAAGAEHAPRRLGTVEPPRRARRSKARRWAAPLAGCSRATAQLPKPRRQPPGVPLPARADEPHSPVLPPSVVGRLFEVSEHRPQPPAPGGRRWSKRRAPRPDGPQGERQPAAAPPRRGGRVPPPPRQGR